MFFKKLNVSGFVIITIFCGQLWLSGCASQKTIANDAVVVEDESAAKVFSIVHDGNYHSSKVKNFDLLHTSLKLEPNWDDRTLSGQAQVFLKPHFYNQSILVLDARAMDIQSVNLLDSEKNIEWSYDGEKIEVIADEVWTRNDTLAVEITYLAQPYLWKSEPDSIPRKYYRKDQGLFFINADKEDPNKPKQLWTQGETSYNSCWFPTIDQPNEKTTLDLFVTVDSNLVTLSNGQLVASENTGAKRIDHWQQLKPHAPYLTALVVGEYAVVEDSWRGIPVNYLVEAPYKAHAKAIFGKTPAMLSYFSELFQYDYPWDKYSQVVVRDYFSGAMENTSASLFMEELHRTERELLDDHWEGIIAHELAHQWFGNLVTCESWANLALNESFATYAEYLWFEHEYGVDEAEWHRKIELENYLSESHQKLENLIRYNYEEESDLFDAHSYSKGAVLLHYLRTLMGDEAFFTSLSYYLHSRQFGTAEVHDLRESFEEVTGVDWLWFFDDFALHTGHPVLHVTDTWSDSILTVVVNQDVVEDHIFQIPTIIRIWSDSSFIDKEVILNNEVDSFTFKLTDQPKLVLLDPDASIPGVVQQSNELVDNIVKYRLSSSVLHQHDALVVLENYLDEPSVQAVLLEAISHPYKGIREQALDLIKSSYKDGYPASFITSLEGKIRYIIEKDPSPAVKSAALDLIAYWKLPYKTLVNYALKDSSYQVISHALFAYVSLGLPNQDQVFSNFEKENNYHIEAILADYYTYRNVSGKLPWFVDKLEHADAETISLLLSYIGNYSVTQPVEIQDEALTVLLRYLKTYNVGTVRSAAFHSLMLMSHKEGLLEELREIARTEPDEELQQMFLDLLIGQ